VKVGFAPVALLLLLTSLVTGCRPEEAAAETFEAWEVGRTLIFENPAIPEAPPLRTRFQERLQKQVVRTTDGTAGRRIETVFTTFQGQQAVNLLLKGGGVSLVDSQGRLLIVLPEGFPDRKSSWESTGYRLRVLGRARWERNKPEFPATRPPEGVWVEGEPLQGGVRIRIFYLPDFGEVEKREWRDGKWVTTNLMVGWSFQEIPRPRDRG
jgi:hypothetical protein